LCESKIASLDKLVPDEKIRAAIAAHEERKKQTDADEGAEKVS
jgi:hypothetical protein